MQFRTYRAWFTVAVALSLVACGDDSTPSVADSGVMDSAVSMMDATPPDDTGTPPPPDTGTPPPPVDAGPPPPPPPAIEFGEAITADPNVWTYVPFEGSSCMNQTSFGIGVNLNPDSDNVVVYFQGGNLCFDFLSCIVVANPDGFSAATLNPSVNALNNGIFARDDAANPVADWNFVFVPYCSGDLHAGNIRDSYRGNDYLGYSNTTQFLGRIVPTFESSNKVLITGSSAGGFGAMANFGQAVDAWGSRGSAAKLYLLDDAGPPMTTTYMPACFQNNVRTTFGINSIPLFDDCPECTDTEGGGLVNVLPFWAERYPDLRMAMLSSTGDSVIRNFYSYGNSPMCNRPTNQPAEDYEAGLIEARDEILSGNDNFKYFLKRGEFHTFLGARFDSDRATVSGTTLSDFLSEFLNDDPSWDHVGPD